MKEMIQQLKQTVIDQESYVDCLSKRLASAMKHVETEEQCDECDRLFRSVSDESARLLDLRHSLFYLRRAEGHKDVDTFYPERF